MTEESVAKLKTLADSLAAELIFAQPGKDEGLLPVNSLLLEVEDLAGPDKAPAALAAGVQAARLALDEVFAGPSVFTAESVAELGNWVTWFQKAVGAAECGLDITPWAGGAPPAQPERAAASAGAVPDPANVESSTDEDAPLVLHMEQDADLIREFIHEAGEHLQNIEEGALILEESPSHPDTLNSIFRAFHTFKGGAGFLNLTPIHDLAHELESLLDRARQQQLPITREVIDLILEGGDCLKRFSELIDGRLAGKGGSDPIRVPTAALLGRIRAVLAGRLAVATGSRPVETPTPKAETVISKRVEEDPGKAGSGPTSVKVDTQKLDGLIDAVGEMVIAQSLVVQNPALQAVENEQLTRNLAELARITKDLQRTAMSLRMVPIRSTFQKMHRVVRDLSGKLGKQVELITAGEDTELDRTIVEELGDPLVHMVRNAVDHGVEMPAARRKQGKPDRGTVRLKAFHQGGNIVIEIRDDGNGLDRAAILNKARERGLVKDDEELPDSEIFNLVFAPGFSTAPRVTEVSGRGVGMDVVRRNIEKLRGKIEIQSRRGEGSTFSIFLPLTLAIIDGLLVGIGDNRYILPALTVSESFRPTATAIKSVQGRGEMIDVRGRLRPLVRLYEHLGVEPSTTNLEESIVIVVQSSSDARCVLVDKLLGKQEVVIKSLGETFHSNRYVAGAAILGDGRVGLILDSQALVQLDSGARSPRSAVTETAHLGAAA